MRFLARTFCGRKFESRFVLDAILVLAIGLYPSVTGAQQALAGAVPSLETPRAAAVFQNPIPAAQLAFLSDYSGKTARSILKDKRFRNLTKRAIPDSECRYGHDVMLCTMVVTLLDNDPMPIRIRDGRYAMVASRGGPMVNGYGFLWFDLEDGIAIGGVYSHPTNGESAPELAIFSRQLRDSSLSIGQFPPAFQRDLSQWILATGLYLVSTRYFIPENGKRYALLHDEDYCAYRRDIPPPPRAQCEELNAEAAEVDVNAAYFLAQTHNAANAPAWTLGPDQEAWMGKREQSCGLGPAGLLCRLRLTRQRTQVLIASQRN